MGSNSKGTDGRTWRRMALAVLISFTAHLVLVVVLRPDYKPVADYAVNLEVMKAAPGPPPKAEPAPPEEKIESPAEPAPKKPAPRSRKKKPPEPMPEAVVLEKVPVEADAGADAGPVIATGPAVGSDAGVDGGTGGICMHDLFGFSIPDPTWLLWLNVASFHDTVFQTDIARFLSTYQLSKRITSATGIAPETDVGGVLVSTGNLFDWQAYRTIFSHESGEKKIKGALEKSLALTWKKTDQGWRAATPGAFQWHLAGAGRVAVVEAEPTSDGGPADNVGPAPRLEGATQDSTTSNESWPGELGCLTYDPNAKTEPENDEKLLSEARAYLAPDDEGHWPVALLATTDRRALGLPLRGTGLKLDFATIRIYFTNPIRIEGRIRFRGKADRVAALANRFQAMAAEAKSDPMLRLLGLSNLFKDIELTSAGNDMLFTAKISENQGKAALVFLSMQAEALERYMDEK